jgi:signal transduction histidine kinase
MTPPPAAAEAALEIDEARAGWVRFYARVVARLGAVYQLVVLGTTLGRRPSAYDVTILGLWLVLVVLLRTHASPRVLGRYLVAAFSVGSFLSLHAQGFLGVTGALICTLPLCAAVFTGRAGATTAALAILVAYGFFAYAHLSGVVDASTRALQVSDLNAWIWVTIAFLLLTASTVALLGKVIEDQDHAARRYLHARDQLELEWRSRIGAERARDAALSARERARDVEALGLIAGSALHDVNNMAMVLGSWAELLQLEPGASAEALHAAQNIRAVCRRLGTLGRDVLGLGRAQTSPAVHLHLDQALPAAAVVLRRALPEDIGLEVSPPRADALPAIPLQNADLVHVLLEAVASLVPRLSGGSAIALSASGNVGSSRADSASLLTTIVIRHVGPKRDVQADVLVSEDEEMLTTDDIAIVQRRPDPDSVELSLYRAPRVTERSS